MSFFRLVYASLYYHGRANLAVACGVAVGTAVLTGALLVGDSMRGSLRDLTLDRLGSVDEALVSDRFFRQELAAEREAVAKQREAVPVILLRASLERAESDPPRRANQVQVVGCNERFWGLWGLPPEAGTPERAMSRGGIVLNKPVARQLGVAAGDTVLLRLPRPGAIPAESALGRKQQTVRSLRLAISAVVPVEGPGRFGLEPSQRLPRNAYVSLADLQDALGEPGRVNAILVSEENPFLPPRETLGAAPWRPQLADYGIQVQEAPGGYLNITSDRMILRPAAEKAVLDALAGMKVQPVLTYLANTIACRNRQIPYSTITAIDFADGPPLGPFLSTNGKPVPPLADGQIALNSWAAEDLGAKPGDTIRVDYFEPESTHGEARQATAEFRLAAVVELSGAAADRALTPAVRGITDQLSMTNWDPPFPFDLHRIRPKDEQYWREYRAVPKAFVSLAAGRRLWASRFGQTTSLRLTPGGTTRSGVRMTAESLTRRLVLDPAAMGFVFQPVRAQGLAASAGTTPFGVLFLMFSAFVIAAAMMLVVLLFRLGIDRRAQQIGMLLAVGFRRRQIARLLAAEGFLVAALGSVLGALGGIGYAALMLAGLRTWWLAAISTPFLRLHVTSASLWIGMGGGLAGAMAAIWLSARRLTRVAPRRLLAGELSTAVFHRRLRSRKRLWIDVTLVTLAAVPAAVLLAVPVEEDVRAGAFFGAGAAALAALLALAWLHLRWGATGPAVARGRGNLLRLALRSAARNPGRSGLSIALAATACFLIAATSAFRLDPVGQVPRLSSGNGGFALVAQSDQPIYYDFGTREGRTKLGFPAEDDRLLAECRVFALRLKPGDDASCLNLYQPRQPRLLGLPRAFLDRGGFAWADAPPDLANPWLTLAAPPVPGPEGGATDSGSHQSLATSHQPLPVVLDQATANYALHLWKGRGEQRTTNDARGRPLRLEVAGLLANSIFQGDLLVSEEALLDYDPAVSGYRFFLIETPPDQTAAVQQALERNLGDFGLAAETTADRLAGFLAVQNTYLSTFQSLGGLGLLLGTIGLAAAQLRGVLERRGELALLRAAGFRRALLAKLVVLETLAVLLAGLAVGILAALVAILPHLAGHGASIPWQWLAAMLGLVLAAGLLASLAAVRAVARQPLLAALREDR
ncbi:MAG: ABC transporter permease [Thermoguttaceae bacterium]|jgi:ABC-type lipoprotein release transport system permease subunit